MEGQTASVDDQLREAVMMMPFLLIGAGKVALNHFRHAGMLLGDGSPLKYSAFRMKRFPGFCRIRM